MADIIERLLSFHSRLLLSIHGIAESDLKRPERAEAWSVAEVIAHLGDVELLTAVRLRMMVAEDAPRLPGFSQNVWVARLHRNESLAEILEQFWSARRNNVRLYESLLPEQRARTGEHPRRGVMTVDELIAFVDEHQERHLSQIERIKTTLGLVSADVVDVSRVSAAVADRNDFRSPGPGVRVHDLWRSGVRRALQVEIDAGARWPGVDYHMPGPEEVFVVAGDFNDGRGRYGAGTFLHHPAGSSHSPWSETGCVLFVYYPEG
jgi:anti-sigma factor ChrR (cupin superfamily)